MKGGDTTQKIVAICLIVAIVCLALTVIVSFTAGAPQTPRGDTVEQSSQGGVVSLTVEPTPENSANGS